MLTAVSRSPELQTRIGAAFSCFGWVMLFVGTGLGSAQVGSLFGLVYHLSLAPVVANLRAPYWATMAGFVWIYSDAVLDVARLNNLDEEIIWAFRLGIHIAAAIWIIGTSLNMPLRMKLPGILLGSSLALHAMLSPYLPDSELVLGVTAIPLMVIWLMTIAFSYSHTKT
ncbi:hypothetical protein [Devosia riboflavina]